MKSLNNLEDDDSIDNDDDVVRDDETEERLEKSNWPMFDSISVDADYDESIVVKREGNPSNKRTTLYIIREVFTFRKSVTLIDMDFVLVLNVL